MAKESRNNILDREREIYDLFKSQDIVMSANRLFDFIMEFGGDYRDWKQDCIIFCNRASNIHDADRRRKLGGLQEYQDLVTSLLYDMMELLETVIAELVKSKAA